MGQTKYPDKFVELAQQRGLPVDWYAQTLEGQWALVRIHAGIAGREVVDLLRKVAEVLRRG